MKFGWRVPAMLLAVFLVACSSGGTPRRVSDPAASLQLAVVDRVRVDPQLGRGRAGQAGDAGHLGELDQPAARDGIRPARRDEEGL